MNTPLPKGRYLVTGGAGFVGSHLCDRLLSLDCEVIAVDNLITGRRENLKAALSHSRFTFIEQDVIEPLKITGGIAGVFHMASPASPVDYLKYPIQTLYAGSIGSDRILTFAKEKQAPILVASTSEVYGDPAEHPQKESYWGNVNPIGPRGCYDESKRYMEALTMAYRREFQVRTHIVRIFNTYGPRMRTNDGRVIPNFCMQALKNEPITIYGDGTQTRSFCYVDDLVEGLMRLLQSDYYEPVNIGNPGEYTMLELSTEVKKACDSRSTIEYLPLPVDDPKRRCPDITRAKQLLGWEPKIPLKDGIQKTLDYFRSAL